jgi:hypothetical protein
MLTIRLTSLSVDGSTKKLDVKGRVTEFRARFCAKSFTQRYGIDFYETFAPVAKIKSIRALAQIGASEVLVNIIENEGFKPINADSCIYIKRLGKEIILSQYMLMILLVVGRLRCCQDIPGFYA